MQKFWLPSIIDTLLFCSNSFQLLSIFCFLDLPIKFSFSRYRSISHTNSLASFTTECEPFFFHALKLVLASSHLINLDIKKDRLLMFYKTVWVGSNPSPLTYCEVKKVDISLWWYMLCVVIIFLFLISNLYTSLRFKSMILKLSVMTRIGNQLSYS